MEADDGIYHLHLLNLKPHTHLLFFLIPMSKARPRPRRVTTSDYDADVGTSQMTTEEEDDFFITKRSDSGWKALNKLSQGMRIF